MAAPVSDAPKAKKAPIWTRVFILLYGAQFLGYCHEGLLSPIIPLYVISLGGSAAIAGLVVAGYSVTSVFLRPSIGAWADRHSEVVVLRAGAGLLGISALALLTPVIWVAGIVNAARGTGWAGLNTGGSALVAHIAPVSRRAEVSGYYSLFQGAGIGFAPTLALWMLSASGGKFSAIFVLAAACGLAAMALSYGIASRHAEAAEARSLPEPAQVRAGWTRFFEREMLLPAILLVSLQLTQPSATTFVTLYARSLGIDVGLLAWYFIAIGVTGLAARGLLGRMADRLPRAAAIIAGLIALVLGLFMLLVASHLPALIAAGVLFALGQAIVLPALTAVAIDRSHPRRRGAAMASFGLAYQVGLGVGSAATGAIIQFAGFQALYLSAIGCIAAGLAVAAAKWSALSSGHRPSTG